HAANREIAEWIAGNPREAWRDVDRAAVVRERHRTVQARPHDVQCPWREGVLVFRRHVRVPSALDDERDWRFVGRNAIDRGPVVGDADEQAVGGREAMIETSLVE